jgi:hypothetical protein
MGKLSTMPAMQNPDLRSKTLFFLSDKALSICCDFKAGTTGGVKEDVAPLANAFVWLLGSQKGMSEVFLKGLCYYCPFVYQVSLEVSEDNAVNKLELGYSSETEQPEKWKKKMILMLSFYASLIVRGYENERAGGAPLTHFTLHDAWRWLSRTVNFCVR